MSSEALKFGLMNPLHPHSKDLIYGPNVVGSLLGEFKNATFLSRSSWITLCMRKIPFFQLIKGAFD